jgi:hypothetical protein
VNAVINLRVPKNARKLSSGYTTCGLLSSARLRRICLLVSLVSMLLRSCGRITAINRRD